MSGLRAVLLDVGGVLLLPGPEKVRPVLPCPPPATAVLDAAHYHALTAAYPRTATPDWDIYFRVYATRCGVAPADLPEAVAGLRRVFGVQVWTRIVPGAPELLTALRAAELRVALVSNADGRLAAHLRELGLCRAGAEVDLVLDSAVVGVAKPSPRIFTLALDGLGVAPDEAVHVGDTVAADVLGAHAAGVRAVHFVPHGDCATPAPAHEHMRSLAGLLDLL